MAAGDVFPPRGMPGPVPENWARQVEDRVSSVETGLVQLQQNSSGDNRNMASQVEQLAALVRALPIQRSDNWRVGGIGITGTWTTYAAGGFQVPPGKTTASILAIGTAAVVDTTTGGLTTAYGRCVIGGSIGGESPAAKDAGASQVNNVITATHAASFPVIPGATLTFGLQLYGLNGSAYPARPNNYAQIAVVATFS